MRKFSKINESMEDKDPIDPSEDVKEFKEKFFGTDPEGPTAKTIRRQHKETAKGS